MWQPMRTWREGTAPAPTEMMKEAFSHTSFGTVSISRMNLIIDVKGSSNVS